MSGIVFLYQFIPTLVFFVLALCAIFCTAFVMPRMGIDLSNPGTLEALITRFANPVSIVLGLVGWLIVILAFLLFQLTCSYLARLGLAHMAQKKKFNFSSLLREWRGMWSWAGTGLATSVYFITTFIVTAILAVVCVYIYDMLVAIPVILGGATFVFLGISLAFTFPVYFFEGKRYFVAAEKSRDMVKGRWWKTLWNFVLLGLAIMLVSMIIFGLESGVRYTLSFLPDSLFESMFITAIFAIGAFVSMIFQSAINIIIQLFAIFYTFELYHEYDKVPVHTKK
jgi:hypothetical protein